MSNSKPRDLDEIYDALIYEKLFTEAELQLVTNLCGYSVKTFEDIMEVRYGHSDLP